LLAFHLFVIIAFHHGLPCREAVMFFFIDFPSVSDLLGDALIPSLIRNRTPRARIAEHPRSSRIRPGRGAVSRS
jgi:hypothetical protein